MNADLMHDSVIDFQDFVLFVEFSEKKKSDCILCCLPHIRYMEASQNAVALYGFCIREAGIVFSDFRMHCWVICTIEYNTISVVSLFIFPCKERIPFCSKLERQHNSTCKLIAW